MTDFITPEIAALLSRLLMVPPEAVAAAVGYSGSKAAALAGAVFNVLTAVKAKEGETFQLMDITAEAKPLQDFAKSCPAWNLCVCRPADPKAVGTEEGAGTPSAPSECKGGGKGNGNDAPSDKPEGNGKSKGRSKGKGESEGKGKGEGEGEGDKPAEPKPEEKKPEPKPEPKPKKPAPPKPEDKTLLSMLGMVKAGLRNLWLHGPAGCGKTTNAHALAEQLGVPCYVLSCSKDTDPCQIQGRRYPEAEEAPFAKYYESPSILVLDEFTSVEADTAMLLNAALANGQFETSTKRVCRRHPDCVIVATSNTLGLGGDALYNGNQRLDASTRDRFACGFIPVDYSKEYESKFDPEVVAYATTLREVIKRCDLQQICSTRSIINAHALKQAGLDWKAAMVSTWTKEELTLLPKDPEPPTKKTTQEGLGI